MQRMCHVLLLSSSSGTDAQLYEILVPQKHIGRRQLSLKETWIPQTYLGANFLNSANAYKSRDKDSRCWSEPNEKYPVLILNITGKWFLFLPI